MQGELRIGRSSWRGLQATRSFVSLFLARASVGPAAGAIPGPEHPGSQFERGAWLNLGGRRDFAFDFDVVGIEQGWAEDHSRFEKKITVPFCPDSRLSDIEYKTLIPAVLYHRTLAVSRGWDGRSAEQVKGSSANSR